MSAIFQPRSWRSGPHVADGHDLRYRVLALAHDDSRGSPKRARRLKIDIAAAETARQIAPGAISNVELELVRSRLDRANDDPEAAIAIQIGCHDTKFHGNYLCGDSLSCSSWLKATGSVGRKLTEGSRILGAKEMDADLVEFARLCTSQFIYNG